MKILNSFFPTLCALWLSIACFFLAPAYGKCSLDDFSTEIQSDDYANCQLSPSLTTAAAGCNLADLFKKASGVCPSQVYGKIYAVCEGKYSSKTDDISTSSATTTYDKSDNQTLSCDLINGHTQFSYCIKFGVNKYHAKIAYYCHYLKSTGTINTAQTYTPPDSQQQATHTQPQANQESQTLVKNKNTNTSPAKKAQPLPSIYY